MQIAEILYRDRTFNDMNLLSLEDDRNKSKKWRNEICKVLLGKVRMEKEKSWLHKIMAPPIARQKL